jgi:hypothetical protein
MNDWQFITRYDEENKRWVGCIVFSDTAGDESDDLYADTLDDLHAKLTAWAIDYHYAADLDTTASALDHVGPANVVQID